MRAPIVFEDNESGYQAWLKSDHNGYVLNMHKRRNPEYAVLHRAHCKSISNFSDLARKGAYTERGYIKICSSKLVNLSKWLKSHGRPDGSFSKICSKCY